MNLLDLPCDVLCMVKTMTYVSYLDTQTVSEDFNDPLIRWYHNRLRNYYFNRFSEVCKEVAWLEDDFARTNKIVSYRK